MRLVGILVDGRPSIGVEIGTAIAVVSGVDDFYADVERGLGIARSATIAGAAEFERSVPVPATAKVLCAGLNYVNHAAESKKELPTHPDVFGRWASTLVPGGVTVPLPSNEPGLDWEGELAAVIGVTLKDATPEEVEAGILGYTCLNDLSARLHQRATGQWTIGKNADLSAPMGPVIVTRDELPEPYGLRLETRVNGETMQSTITGEMIFRIGQIGAYASETMTLRPGDVISTGTPQGIGSARRPAIFLTTGDVVEVEIESIGVLSTPIGAQTGTRAATTQPTAPQE
jgi:2-keto-4-pentenoate hydratase/2-oxohepta-3-ene-1,7-dioic acid hydratase in catechol pathway